METIRVVLADDHPLMRSGIRNLLQKAADIVVIGEASDGYQALNLVSSLSPDVLLLDIEMPGMKGTEVAQELEASGSNVPVLILSGHAEKEYILGVLATGAAGYLSKEEAPETIVKAVRGVANGQQRWISDHLANKLNLWPGEDVECE